MTIMYGYNNDLHDFVVRSCSAALKTPQLGIHYRRIIDQHRSIIIDQ